MKAIRSVAFLFIGGSHQIFHAAPIAAELALRTPDTRIVMFCLDQCQRDMIAEVMALYGAAGVTIERLRFSRWIVRLLKLVRAKKRAKKLLLLLNRRLLARFDAIVVPERTSACLRAMGLRRPKLIHLFHGAGDRALASDRKLGKFDLVVVPGEKDARRAIDAGLLAPGQIAVAGYAKFDLVSRLPGRQAPLFDNGRPTVVYNPHFDSDQSSWSSFGLALIERFRAQDDFNLIVAPHMRLFEHATEAQRSGVEALSEPGKIIVDTGSQRSIDMTYTLCADLYLGDISSQVYEFIVRPRPCIFLNARGVEWSHDPRFACWHLGDVVSTIDDLIPAIARALRDPLAREPRQRAALVDAVGHDFDGAAARGASAVLSYLDQAAA